MVIGQGSNLLFIEDFNGAVLINRLLGIEHQQDQDFHYLRVQGGESWHQLVKWSLEQHIYGLENLALIPGCAGSAPIQNIGAYGVEFKDFCDYVELINLATGELLRLNNAQCQFSYRDSIFKHQYQHGFVITAVGLKLAKNWQPRLQYGPLAKFNANCVDAQQIFDEICTIRQSKLPDPKLSGNAGSFFKNPVIRQQQFQQLISQYPSIPHYPQADGSIKLAAGWLIDQCALKGYQIGGAAVHQQQALVLINKANASSKDVLYLARYIRQRVGAKFDVWLEPEVRFIASNGEIDSVKAIS